MTRNYNPTRNFDVYQIASNGGSLAEVLAAREPNDTPDDVTDALDVYDRDDLLTECLQDPTLKDSAQTVIEGRAWRKKMDEQWQAKVDAYPAIFKRWRAILTGPERRRANGLYDVSYPSNQALRHGLGDNYVAISGDGLWMFHFEILSMDDSGMFRFLKHPTGKDDLGKPASESSLSRTFRNTAQCGFGDTFSGDQICEIFKQIF